MICGLLKDFRSNQESIDILGPRRQRISLEVTDTRRKVQCMVRNRFMFCPSTIRYDSNIYIQVARTGEEPSAIDVYIMAHKGPDPSQPEVLPTPLATERLVSWPAALN